FANPELALTQKLIGFRAILVTPLQREGASIGTIGFYRLTPGAFSERQIALIETFADQAVIAIENTRLFEAEQASKRELQESLEYQTATSEVLGVISRSATELQPVLDAIVQTAHRLCDTSDTILLLIDGGHLRIGAHQGAMGVDFEMQPIGRDRVAGRGVVDRIPVHVHD